MKDLSCNVESVLKEKLRTSVFYSLALDESTDQTDTAQLAIFIRGVYSNFDVFEELLSIASLKDRTTGEDMFKALKNVMEFYDLRFENFAGVATDGAPSMIGKHSGLVAFLKEQDGIDRNTFIDYHCIILQENLCAKTLRFDAVMKVVKSVVKFIRAKALKFGPPSVSKLFNIRMGSRSWRRDLLLRYTLVESCKRAQKNC